MKIFLRQPCPEIPLWVLRRRSLKEEEDGTLSGGLFLRKVRVVDCCEHGNESLTAIKCAKFLYYLSNIPVREMTVCHGCS